MSLTRPQRSDSSGDGEAVGDGPPEAFRVLGEPRQRATLQMVAYDELAAGEIAAAFAQPTGGQPAPDRDEGRWAAR